MGILDLVFPKTCLGCGHSGSYICPDCLAKVRTAQPICPYCERASIDGVTHVRCQKKLGIDGLVSIWEYEGVIRKAILALKYKYATLIGQELSSCFLSAVKSQNTKYLMPGIASVVPIPIYWRRQNVRGFNQSIEVGKIVSEALNLGFIPDLLIKKQPTVPQAELSGDMRRRNLKGVFSLNTKYPNLEAEYTIFDDVFTTGSTLCEAAKVLKRAGAKKVWGLTIAR
jgi:competence protein ComFC